MEGGTIQLVGLMIVWSNAAQQLHKSKCSQIAGFQDVTCGVALSFNVEPDEFVQIINNRNGHWLTYPLLVVHIQQ